MPLTRVTITGADDNTDPVDLAKLSEEFPFVEWGILFSETRRGTPRFPSLDWLQSFYTIKNKQIGAAAHLCGLASRQTMLGMSRWMDDLVLAGPVFQRVQINGFDLGAAIEKLPSVGAGLSRIIRSYDGFELILQVRREVQLKPTEEYALFVNKLGDPKYVGWRKGQRQTSILYDYSGGAGRMPPEWPAEVETVGMGYAGGIGPDNVIDVLDRLGTRKPYWIDMESHVRTDDAFDLEKVRSVLSQVVERIAP